VENQESVEPYGIQSRGQKKSASKRGSLSESGEAPRRRDSSPYSFTRTEETNPPCTSGERRPILLDNMQCRDIHDKVKKYGAGADALQIGEGKGGERVKKKQEHGESELIEPGNRLKRFETRFVMWPAKG